MLFRSSRQQDGKLLITARKASLSSEPDWGGQIYTSARLITRGKASWTYGFFEIRAKMPCGQGTWPAIWMLPEDWAYGAWPRSGEIDIMEAVNLGQPCETCQGGAENRVLGTIHFGGEPPRNRYITEETQLADPTAFHTYEVEWDRDEIGRAHV